MSAKVYIATYSAHATILEKIVKGFDAQIEKLYVCYGGLKAPAASYDKSLHDKIFKGKAFSDKVLHAKVLLKDDGSRSALWLWTGNLRKSTNTSQNVLLSLPISGKHKNDVRKWFDKTPTKHLVVHVGEAGITKIEQNSLFFKAMKDSIKSLRLTNLNAHVFSPWGSTSVLEKISGVDAIQNISIYTRHALSNCWVDYKDVGKKIVGRYVAKELNPFPHAKCLFLENSKKQTVWAYIGSANFTRAAMETKENKENVESGVFFEGVSACKSIYKSIIQMLRKESIWEVRNGGRSGTYDDSDYSYEDEQGYSVVDSSKGFELRKLKAEIESLFSSKKEQRKLEKIYCTNADGSFDYDPYKLQLVFVDDFFYHLLARRKENDDWVEVDVERKVQGPPPASVRETSNEFSRLFNLITMGELNPEKDSLPSQDEPPELPETDEKKSHSFVNVRFPIEKIVNNKKLIKEIKSQAAKVKSMKIEALQESEKILLSNWLPLIERL
ncbi:MAG: hypothetical protein MJY78_07325 [Fibrobacter sp.]|nr:hypothetical protein [Fibrobacter sp.]